MSSNQPMYAGAGALLGYLVAKVPGALGGGVLGWLLGAGPAAAAAPAQVAAPPAPPTAPAPPVIVPLTAPVTVTPPAKPTNTAVASLLQQQVATHIVAPGIVSGSYVPPQDVNVSGAPAAAAYASYLTSPFSGAGMPLNLEVMYKNMYYRLWYDQPGSTYTYSTTANPPAPYRVTRYHFTREQGLAALMSAVISMPRRQAYELPPRNGVPPDSWRQIFYGA